MSCSGRVNGAIGKMSTQRDLIEKSYAIQNMAYRHNSVLYLILDISG